MKLPDTFLSLRQMCFSSTAFTVFNDPDVRRFWSTHDIHSCIWSSEEIESLLGKEPATLLNDAQVNEILSKGMKPTLSHEYKDRFTGDAKHHSLPNRQWETLVDQKLSALLLPNVFKKEVMALVRLILIESFKWLQDHKPIIMSTTNLENHFHWTQDNKIDRQKSAKAIISDVSIDIRDRFMLASHYCFKEDVLSIWKILDDAQQSFFQECDFDMARIWANWARNGVELDWEEIAHHSNGFGLQSYFPKLEQEKRLQHLMRYRRGILINYHELRFCLSILEQKEINEILQKCPFQILELFLDWSVQEKLLDAVELLWPYLSEQNFRDFLYLILSQKRMLNWITSDYVKLVKKLWKRVPFEYCKVIESDAIFNTLRFALEYDGSSPFPHELRVHSNENIFTAFHAGNTVFVISRYKCNFSDFMFSLSGICYLYRRINMLCFTQD